MHTETKPKRIRLTGEQVMAHIQDRIPDLTEHMFEDRDWIWYCGPTLAGEGNKPIREELKEIGFRFCPGGHVMPDGETRGSWGHSCQRPTFIKRRKQGDDAGPSSRDLDDPISAMKSLGL